MILSKLLVIWYTFAQGPVGYLTKTRQVPVPSRLSSDATRPGPVLISGRERGGIERLQRVDSASPLELFIMMRTGKLSPEVAKMSDTSNSSEG